MNSSTGHARPMNERGVTGFTDDELIRATLGGDDRAFQELVERYKTRAFGVVVGIVGNRDDALDVVQESFVKAFYKLKEFRFGSELLHLVLPPAGEPGDRPMEEDVPLGRGPARRELAFRGRIAARIPSRTRRRRKRSC